MKGINDFFRSLYQFNEYPVSRDGSLVVSFGVNKSYIVTSRAFADPARSEPDSLLLHPVDGVVEMVNPKTKMVQGRNVDLKYNVSISKSKSNGMELVEWHVLYSISSTHPF